MAAVGVVLVWHEEGSAKINSHRNICPLSNLKCTNAAIRYKPEGGTVDLSVTNEDGQAILRIQDSGPGIQVAERQRVFAPFYRTLGSDQAGSGLGLAIVKAITDRIGAKMQLAFTDEARHSGLRVQVFISLVKPSHQASESPKNEQPLPQDTKSI
jgi:K+-sensing histidine kinase KdpD